MAVILLYLAQIVAAPGANYVHRQTELYINSTFWQYMIHGR